MNKCDYKRKWIVIAILSVTLLINLFGCNGVKDLIQEKDGRSGENVDNALLDCKDTNSDTLDTEDNKDLRVVAEKPVIYLYGYDNERVSVKLDIEGEMTCSYPEYNDESGWVVMAQKDGTLESSDKKNTYPYLYWEGEFSNIAFDFDKGFCFKGEETAEKLNDVLKEIGLNDRERADFITYWLPKLKDNKYNVISFQTKPYSQQAKLTIEPKPKTVSRIFMAYYASNSEVSIKPQKFTALPREGAYCVEWGGCKVSSVDFMPIYIDREKLMLEDSAEDSEENEDETKEEDNSNEAEINRFIELSLEDNAKLQQEYLQKIQNLQSAVYYKMLGVTSVPSSVQSQVVAMQKTQGTHPYTDSQGNQTSYTDEEWERLKNIWAYTGHPEDLIKQHSVSELNNLLGKK